MKAKKTFPSSSFFCAQIIIIVQIAISIRIKVTTKSAHVMHPFAKICSKFIARGGIKVKTAANTVCAF